MPPPPLSPSERPCVPSMGAAPGSPTGVVPGMTQEAVTRPGWGEGVPAAGPGAGTGHPHTAAWRGPRQASRVFLRPAGPDGAEVRQPEAERRKRRPHQGHQQAVQVGQAPGCWGRPVSAPAGRAGACLWPPAAQPPHPGSDSSHQGTTATLSRLGIQRRLGVARPASDPASRCPAARPCHPGADSPLSPRGDAGGGSSSGCGSTCPELGRPGSSPSRCCYSPSLVPPLRVPGA